MPPWLTGPGRPKSGADAGGIAPARRLSACASRSGRCARCCASPAARVAVVTAFDESCAHHPPAGDPAWRDAGTVKAASRAYRHPAQPPRAFAGRAFGRCPCETKPLTPSTAAICNALSKPLPDWRWGGHWRCRRRRRPPASGISAPSRPGPGRKFMPVMPTARRTLETPRADFRVGGGESLSSCRLAVSANCPYRPTASRRPIAVVAHGGVLDCFYRAAVGLPLACKPELGAGQCKHQPPVVR